MAAIMVIGMIGSNVVPNAEALKGKGVGISQYGSNTNICGLVLCSEYSGGKEAYEENWTSSFRSQNTVPHVVTQDKSETKHVPVSTHNADEEFPTQLDVFIHKFELDKITADEALDGIKEVHDAYVNAKVTNDIVNSVGDKINLYSKGTFDAAAAVEAIHLSAEPQNVNPEYQGALDEVIHKFELDKITADEALDGIKEVHDGFVGLYITSDLIEAVDEKIVLIDSGKLSGADAVEAIHLSAEPQNVNPEYQGALDEVIHKFELDKITADEALDGIKEVHDGFVGLYITSDLIEAVDEKIVLIDSGKLSGADAVEAIHLSAEPQNVNPEYQGALDEVIHKFELDKITADEALDGIKEVHDGFVGLYITSDLIEAVDEKIVLIDSGKLSGADAVEAIHLSAEPQNVNPEYQGALDEVIHKFELDKITADEALDGIKEVHDGFVGLYITSDLIEAVDEKIVLIDSGKLSGADAVEAIHLSAEPQNVNPEYQGALDEVIHKFELDKITADEALDGIKEVHDGFVGLYITSDLIEAVDEKIVLIDSGKLSGADAVEAIHLSAEPQNVNPEYQGALDEVIHKFELDKITADEALDGIKEVHDGFVGLYITSDVVDAIGVQINIYESGNDSAEHVLEEIREVIEEAESTLASLESVGGEVMAKELPPNTVDMPIGAGVPGCETSDLCYTPSQLTVSVGTTVTWINSDGSIPHTVTAGWPDSDSVGLDYPNGNGFDSDFMSGGAIFEHTFEVPGEYDYYCQLHPWMIGSVNVE